MPSGYISVYRVTISGIFAAISRKASINTLLMLTR